MTISSLASVLVSHLKCEGHADIQHNELVLLSCDGAIAEIEGEAKGGVLAGNVNIGSTKIKGMLFSKLYYYVVICLLQYPHLVKMVVFLSTKPVPLLGSFKVTLTT